MELRFYQPIKHFMLTEPISKIIIKLYKTYLLWEKHVKKKVRALDFAI